MCPIFGTGLSVITSTMRILNEVSVRKFYFSIAKIFRESMLINSILLNVEVWFAMTKEEVAKFETIDKVFIRKVFQTQCTTPVSFLYLETGIIPIQFLIKARRITFFHYLASLNENEMLFCFDF